LALISCSRVRLPSDALFDAPALAKRRFTAVFSETERRDEILTKLLRIHDFIRQRPLDGVLFTQEGHFSWITGGGTGFLDRSQSEAQSKVLVTPTAVVVIANNIEAPRLRREVVKGLGFRVESYKYFEAVTEEQRIIANYCPDATRIATDASTAGLGVKLSDQDLLDLYYPLTDSEVKKYRWLGRKCSEVIESVADKVRPGMTEFDLQYLVARELWYWDIFPTVNLASVDERAMSLKQPVPKGMALESFVSLSVCARRWGVVVSMSRLLYFGEPSQELLEKFEVSGKVLAAMQSATQVGSTYRDVLDVNEKAYADGGYDDEWQKHVQGGPILTKGRVCHLRDQPDALIANRTVFAFNPTCAGSKHEDTFLLTRKGIEILTPCIRWPKRKHEVGGKVFTVAGLKIVN
jgi:antitoxin VapB